MDRPQREMSPKRTLSQIASACRHRSGNPAMGFIEAMMNVARVWEETPADGGAR
jgi:hypothetical protein